MANGFFEKLCVEPRAGLRPAFNGKEQQAVRGLGGWACCGFLLGIFMRSERRCATADGIGCAVERICELHGVTGCKLGPNVGCRLIQRSTHKKVHRLPPASLTKSQGGVPRYWLFLERIGGIEPTAKSCLQGLHRVLCQLWWKRYCKSPRI